MYLILEADGGLRVNGINIYANASVFHNLDEEMNDKFINDCLNTIKLFQNKGGYLDQPMFTFSFCNDDFQKNSYMDVFRIIIDFNGIKIGYFEKDFYSRKINEFKPFDLNKRNFRKVINSIIADKDKYSKQIY